MRKALGILIILIALFWCWYYGHMVVEYFYYKNQPIFFCFRPPIQVSIINTCLAIIGVFIGVKTYQNALKPSVSSIAVLGLGIVYFKAYAFAKAYL